MKSVAVATLGLFAALASASDHYLRHRHYPVSNSTTTLADAAPTTLTVIATQVHTVISCAATVTNCPARANHTAIGNLPESAKTTLIITDTVVLTTTVCPVSQASSISSSLIGAHSSGLITGSTIQPSAPAVTSNAAGVTPGVSVTDIVTDKTLTSTIGTGSDASTITTTVRSTIRSTITITSTIIPVGYPTPGSGESSAEPTTTITSIYTSTRTVTVDRPGHTTTDVPGAPGYPGVPGGSVPSANPSVKSEDCDAAPATVTVKETVTVPASTVYVTLPAEACATGGASQPVYQPPVTEKAYPTGTDSGNSPAGGDGNAIPSYTASDAQSSSTTDCNTDTIVTRLTTVTMVPYPTGNNGTNTGVPKPSGYARLRR